MMRKRKRLWGLFLSVAVVMMQLPMVAIAKNNTPGDSTIVSFAPLDSNITRQTVTVGTELSGLKLPDTVIATIYHTLEDIIIPEEDRTTEESGTVGSSGDAFRKDGKNTLSTTTTSEEKIPVTWDSEPTYDSNTKGSYIFTANVGSYTLSTHAKLPQIAVTVTENITQWTFVDTENLTGDNLALPGVSMEQQAAFEMVVSMLPTQISATLDGITNAVLLDIISWNCLDYKQDSNGNWPLTGEYTFTAKLPNGYMSDPLPTVKVLIGGGNLYSNEYSGLTITGGVVKQETDGQIKLGNGTYNISGTWNGKIDGTDTNNRKAVITVPNGVTANITLSDMTIVCSKNIDYFCAFAVEPGGEANIRLSGTNTLTSSWFRAGLDVPYNAKVTIDGGNTDKLNVTGGNSSAGIGGSSNKEGGTITINGGVIESTGGAGGAGIGGGINGSIETITINGGIINATSVRGGAGIGSSTTSNGGIIIINDGIINATSFDGAGIGSGADSIGGTITINGGTIEAKSENGAGIGSGVSEYSNNNDGGTIVIRGGTVKAESKNGAGIGSGGMSTKITNSGGIIEISGGTVIASSERGAGIGGGKGGIGPSANDGSWEGDGGQITIAGNTIVSATSSSAAQIGGGHSTKIFTKGVIFEGNTGTVYGSPELPGDVTLPADSTLIIPTDSTLMIPSDTTVTNNGIIENNGTVDGSGTITNNSIINDNSNGIKVTTTGSEVNNEPSEVSITFWKDTQNLTGGIALIGDTIIVQAKVSSKNTLLHKANSNQVIFKIRNTELGRANVANGIATLSLTLTENLWMPDSYTITAEYSGGNGLLPNNTSSAVLIVDAPSYIITASPTALDFGSKTVNDTDVPDAQNITILNTGNSLISGYTVSDNTNFDVAYVSSKIPVNGTATFTVQPKTGLTPNTYNETLIITTTEGSSTTVNVKFVVMDKLYPVTINGGTANPKNAKAGTTVTITATVPDNQQFNHWQISPDVTFTEGNKNTLTAKFTMPAQPVTVTAKFQDKPPVIVSVTDVILDKSSHSLYVNQTVALTATVQPDHATDKSVKWTSSDSSVATVDANGKVTAHAVGTATITVTTNDGNKTAACIVTVKPVTVSVSDVILDKSSHSLYVNQTVALTATVQPDHATDKSVKWTSSDSSVATVDSNGKVTAHAVGTATITVTTNNGNKTAACIVTVKPVTVSVSDVILDKSSHSLYVNQTVSLTATVQPDHATDKSVKWTSSDSSVATVDSNGKVTAHAVGTATITVTTNDGNKTAACIITVKPDTSSSGQNSYSDPESQSSYTVTGDKISYTVSRSALKKLVDTVKSLTLSCDKVSMTFDTAALKAILDTIPATAGNITFTATPVIDLSAFPDAEALIGSHPAYDFTIGYKDNKGNTFTTNVDFPAGSALVSLNDTLIPTETGSLFMVYVDDKGAVTWLDKSSYENGKVLAEFPHFFIYGVVYKAPSPIFTDIKGHWAKKDIEFVVAQGLLSGTENDLFSPNTLMTRGMFVTALGKLAGINPENFKTRSFTDVEADAYYAAYVEWAVQKNIIKETDDKLFSPDAPVTREQMAVMIVNYAEQMDYYIPALLPAVTFKDSDKISTWAAKEVTVMQRAGIVKGKSGNRFTPQASTTRAEGAAVLHRFIKTVIAPATVSGWVKNDSGHWLYYKGGKALTGWQTIGKFRYYFNADGVMHESWKQDTATNQWYYWTDTGAATGWREISGKKYYFDADGIMYAGGWKQINERLYYFNEDGSCK